MKSAAIAILFCVFGLFWTSCTPTAARTNQNFMSPYERKGSPRSLGGPGFWEVNRSPGPTTIEFVN